MESDGALHLTLSILLLAVFRIKKKRSGAIKKVFEPAGRVNKTCIMLDLCVIVSNIGKGIDKVDGTDRR